MLSSILLTALVGSADFAAAAPASSLPTNFNPKQFDIQPDNGGGPQDNCGNGPITLNADTWNSHNMDALIQHFWNSGTSNGDFDFHQAFASNYTVDLSCPDSFTNCVGDPSACSALSGSSYAKEQGWLGIKSILNVQAFFLQLEKVVSNAADGISGALVDFQTKFNPPASPKNLSFARWGLGVVASVVGLGDIHDLIQSSASVYQAHGLGASANMYDFIDLIKSYQSSPGTVFQQQGMFTVPVCQLQYYNWRQSDDMSSSSPPCDCLTATDNWGNKFMDATSTDIQNWIKSKCS